MVCLYPEHLRDGWPPLPHRFQPPAAEREDDGPPGSVQSRGPLWKHPTTTRTRHHRRWARHGISGGCGGGGGGGGGQLLGIVLLFVLWVGQESETDLETMAGAGGATLGWQQKKYSYMLP